MMQEAPCLCFSTDDKGLLLEVNNRLCNALGFEPNELIGRNVDIIYTLSSRIFYNTHLFPLLKLQGSADEIYLTYQTKNKETLPILLNANRIENSSGAINSFAGIVVHNRKKFEDEIIAARKAAELALDENIELIEAKKAAQLHAEELDRQMQKTQKQNEELKLFNRVVTHDLQEPLRKLLIFSSAFSENENEETGRSYVDRIVTSAKHLRSVVAGLQQYVWLTDTTFTPADINLNELLKDAVTALKKEYPDIILSLEADELPTITADGEQFRFLLQEILTNAMRFRKPGNEVHIAITWSKLLMNQFKNVEGHYKYVDHLKLDIEDDGIGIDPRFKDQALDLFKRLHPASGRGAGLSFCKKIAENHGGNLEINSKEGKGTTITVWLPLSKMQTTPVSHNHANKIKS